MFIRTDSNVLRTDSNVHTLTPPTYVPTLTHRKNKNNMLHIHANSSFMYLYIALPVVYYALEVADHILCLLPLLAYGMLQDLLWLYVILGN